MGEEKHPVLTAEEISRSRTLEAVGRGCSFRRGFRTTSGHVGAGTQELQPGVVVTVLYDARTPFVLRQHGDWYRLVGNCYVHEVMDGQAMRKHKAGGAADVAFKVRMD